MDKKEDINSINKKPNTKREIIINPFEKKVKNIHAMTV